MSGSSLIRLEDVARANPDMWFQAYLPGEPERIAALVDRVARAGIGTPVLTVDTAVLANRENNIRSGFSTPLRPSLRLVWDGMLQAGGGPRGVARLDGGACGPAQRRRQAGRPSHAGGRLRVRRRGAGARLDPTSRGLAAHTDALIELFGPTRCMFQSNFPVDKDMCSYAVLWNAFKRLAAGASRDERRALFSGTACRVYRLPDLDGMAGGGPSR